MIKFDPLRPYIYEIIDREKFDKYMNRKTVSVKEALLYVIENKESLTKSAHKYKITLPTLTTHSKNLQNAGIIKKIRIFKPKPPISEKEKRELRKIIRSLLMKVEIETLKKTLQVLGGTE